MATLSFFSPHIPCFICFRTVKPGVTKHSRTRLVLSSAWRSAAGRGPRAAPAVAPAQLQPGPSLQLLLPLENEQKRSRPDRAMVRDRTGNINRRVCCQNPARPLLAGLPAASGNAGPSEDSAAKSTRRETSRMIPQFCGFHARSAGGGAREVLASTNLELRDTPTSSVKICIRVSPYLTSSSIHN